MKWTAPVQNIMARILFWKEKQKYHEAIEPPFELLFALTIYGNRWIFQNLLVQLFKNSQIIINKSKNSCTLIFWEVNLFLNQMFSLLNILPMHNVTLVFWNKLHSKHLKLAYLFTFWETTTRFFETKKNMEFKSNTSPNWSFQVIAFFLQRFSVLKVATVLRTVF